jgi:hypothetical protein
MEGDDNKKRSRTGRVRVRRSAGVFCGVGAARTWVLFYGESAGVGPKRPCPCHGRASTRHQSIRGSTTWPKAATSMARSGSGYASAAGVGAPGVGVRLGDAIAKVAAGAAPHAAARGARVRGSGHDEGRRDRAVLKRPQPRQKPQTSISSARRSGSSEPPRFPTRQPGAMPPEHGRASLARATAAGPPKQWPGAAARAMRRGQVRLSVPARCSEGNQKLGSGLALC